MTTKKYLLLGVILVVFVGVILPTSVGPPKVGVKRAADRQMVDALSLALTQYHSEYGHFPDGDTPAIMRALSGDNPHQMIFIDVSLKQKNPDGSWSDSWGTPYRIELPDGTPHVSSTGKNKIHEPDNPKADDIRSWR